PRKDFILHFDGEFASPEDLVLETIVGRNYGWMPAERAAAIAHVAQVIREDDGQGDLAYRALFADLPRAYRLHVARAKAQEIARTVARLITAYLASLEFTSNHPAASASPYDAFLRANGLPSRPRRGESDLDYSRRLRAAVEKLHSPVFVSTGSFATHDQAF